MWKKILIGLVIFVGLIFGLILWLTGGMTGSVNQFFSLIEQGKLEEAYQSTAEEFRATVSKEEFNSFLSKTALIDFESASWSSREQTTGGRGKLEGTIKTKTGGVIPIKIELVKEEGKWKIFNITKPGAGLIEEKKEEVSKLRASLISYETRIWDENWAQSGDEYTLWELSGLDPSKSATFYVKLGAIAETFGGPYPTEGLFEVLINNESIGEITLSSAQFTPIQIASRFIGSDGKTKVKILGSPYDYQVWSSGIESKLLIETKVAI